MSRTTVASPPRERRKERLKNGDKMVKELDAYGLKYQKSTLLRLARLGLVPAVRVNARVILFRPSDVLRALNLLEA